jgi:hypothetical protein
MKKLQGLRVELKIQLTGMIALRTNIGHQA